METQSKRLLILLERINNHNIHTSPDSDMDDDLMNEMHDCIDMLKANEDKQPEQAQCHIADISNRLFKDEMNKLALEKYPIKLVTTGDSNEEWDENEQYRECWIEGYMCFRNGC